MKYILGLFVLIASAVQAADEPKMLFTPVDLTKVKLLDKQQSILDRIKREPTTIDYRVVELNKAALDSRSMKIPLMGKDLNIFGHKVKKENGLTIVEWSTMNDLLSIVMRDNAVSGLIYLPDAVYTIESLGSGVHVIKLIDQTKFPKD